MNPLQQLLEHGQSFWLDDLTRDLIRKGELERRIERYGLRGITSNPSIFAKAISGSQAYQEAIDRLARQGLSAGAITEALTVEDVRAACDVMRAVYDGSDGMDGLVSLEVSPHLAHDPDATLDEARRLFAAVGRPNVLIKIPGTPACVPAVEGALAAGINVNITLLFSISSYLAVARAYHTALDRRLAAGQDITRVRSVASFFLSRIDVMVDEELARPGHPEAGALEGRSAVANAKLAYKALHETLRQPRWRTLASRGARVQRLLWASTSTKSPGASDVKYVEPLIGPDTITTLPWETAEAFADHGIAARTVDEGVEDAERLMDRLGEAGVDFDAVTERLLVQGIDKFVKPFDQLVDVVDQRRKAVVA